MSDDDEIEIPAWCSAHDSIGRLFTDGSGSCIYTRIVEMERGECVLIPKRLVSESALVVERDATGEWPEWAIDALREGHYYAGGHRVHLDALEAAAKEAVDAG